MDYGGLMAISMAVWACGTLEDDGDLNGTLFRICFLATGCPWDCSLLGVLSLRWPE